MITTLRRRKRLETQMHLEPLVCLSFFKFYSVVNVDDHHFQQHGPLSTQVPQGTMTATTTITIAPYDDYVDDHHRNTVRRQEARDASTFFFFNFIP